MASSRGGIAGARRTLGQGEDPAKLRQALDLLPATYFGGARGTLSLGIAEVSVPTRGRDLGELASPSWWRLEFTADPEKHVILKSVGALGRDAFVTSLKDSLAAAGEHDVLVFVHGYNVTFEDAARRAGQLSVDLKFAGRTPLYSWASAADTRKYTVDESTIDWSRDHFEAFLQLALGEVSAGKVHIIAHSMGNRAVINTLERVTSWQLSAARTRPALRPPGRRRCAPEILELSRLRVYGCSKRGRLPRSRNHFSALRIMCCFPISSWREQRTLRCVTGSRIRELAARLRWPRSPLSPWSRCPRRLRLPLLRRRPRQRPQWQGKAHPTQPISAPCGVVTTIGADRTLRALPSWASRPV